jgi:hypothetical protein
MLGVRVLGELRNLYVGFEVLTAVAMESSVFWGMTPCPMEVSRRFGGKFRLHLEGLRLSQAINKHERGSKQSAFTGRCVPESRTLHLVLLGQRE